MNCLFPRNNNDICWINKLNTVDYYRIILVCLTGKCNRISTREQEGRSFERRERREGQVYFLDMMVLLS